LLPNVVTNLLLFFAFFMLVNEANAQIRSYAWQEPDQFVVIPDSLMNEDAILVEHLQKMEYGYNVSYFTEIRRIRILSPIARNYYSNISVNVNTYIENLKILDARTLKPDGSIITINPSDIFIDGKDFNGDGDFDFINYSIPIPAVDVGDEIEFILKKRIRHYPNFRFTRFAYGEAGKEMGVNSGTSLAGSPYNVFLNSELFCMHSEFQIQTSPEFFITYKCYNGLPIPQVEKDSSRTLVTCSMDNLQPLREMYLSCMHCEVPHISYTVKPMMSIYDFNPSPRSWKDIYQSTHWEFDPEDANYWNKKNYFFSYYEQKIKPLADSGAFFQFRTFYNYFKDHVEVKPLPPYEEEYNIGYFLSKKYMNQRNLMKSYRKMLEILQLPYWYCFVRPKHKGPIDMEFFREGEVADIFLAFRDEKQKLHIIQPHQYFGKTYELDEISPQYRGTSAVLVCREDSIKITMLSIPEHPFTENTSRVVGKLTISPNDSLLQIQSRATITGDISTTNRSLFYMLDSLQQDTSNHIFQDFLLKGLGVDSIHIDSYSDSYPYSFRFFTLANMKNRIQMTDDSLFHLPMEGICGSLDMTIPSLTRKLSLYYPYAYNNTYKLMLNFEQPMEVLNTDKFAMHEEDETASFNSNLTRLNDHAYLLTLNYSLKTTVVGYENFPSLIAVKKAFEQLSSLSLLFRIQGEFQNNEI
jgi:hypothetical protein